MRSSLRTLTTDLEIRSRLAAEGLVSAPALEGRTKTAVAQFRHTASESRWLLSQDLEGDPQRFYSAYQQLARAHLEREMFELPFLKFHDQAAARATKLCSVLMENIRWPYEPMLVSTFSSQYYWTVAGWGVIALPCGEERRLLGIPDLCHELGHTAYSNDDSKFVGEFLIELQSDLMKLVDPSADPTQWNSAAQLTEVFYIWQEGWLQEFVCDLIATYLTGPAFPRQHARLRGVMQPPRSPFYALDLGASHPADDARMQASLSLLTQTGFEAEATELGDLWSEMIKFTKESPPEGYDSIYSPQVLDKLAARVTQGCQDIGLRQLDPTADPALDIPALTNEAWVQILRDPDGYGQWEEETLARLWEEWGV